jgi:hypothetical protein
MYKKGASMEHHLQAQKVATNSDDSGRGRGVASASNSNGMRCAPKYGDQIASLNEDIRALCASVEARRANWRVVGHAEREKLQHDKQMLVLLSDQRQRIEHKVREASLVSARFVVHEEACARQVAALGRLSEQLAVERRAKKERTKEEGGGFERFNREWQAIRAHEKFAPSPPLCATSPLVIRRREGARADTDTLARQPQGGKVMLRPIAAPVKKEKRGKRARRGAGEKQAAIYNDALAGFLVLSGSTRPQTAPTRHDL